MIETKTRVMAEVIDPALATAGKPLELGQDPTKYLERFDLWYNRTSLLADSIGVKDKQQSYDSHFYGAAKIFDNLPWTLALSMPEKAQTHLKTPSKR